MVGFFIAKNKGGCMRNHTINISYNNLHTWGLFFMEKARRTTLEVTYKGVNISADVSADLVGFTFTDNESSKADDIDITLQDRSGRWNREWFPTLGDKITAKIIYQSNARTSVLNCGLFELDEFSTSGGNSGSTVSFKGVSIPQSNTVRRTTRNRAWEGVRLSEIAADVAKTGNMNLQYVTSVDPMFDRRDQVNKSELQFLRGLCDELALSIKVTGTDIVIFNRDDTEQTAPVKQIVFGTTDLLGFSFTTQTHDTYSESKVEYVDPKTGKKTAVSEKDEKNKNGKVIKQTVRVENAAEAQRIAKAKLKNKNRKKTTGSITVIGDVVYRAGATIEIVGSGKWDGKYYIDTATHTVSDGYKTALEISHVNNPKEEKKESQASKRKTAAKQKAEKKKQVKKKSVTKKPVIKKNLNEDEKWIMNN